MIKSLIEKFNNKEYFKKLFLYYILFQPIFELIFFKGEDSYRLFGFTLSTLFRIVWIFVLLLFSYNTIRKKEKLNKYIIFFLVISFIYLILHCLLLSDFKTLVPDNFNYSALSEFFYILRMIIPLYMIYLSYNFKIKEREFERVLIVVSTVISLTIIISNIFKISYGTYSDKIIDGNIIDWFINPKKYYSFYLGSKGFFNHGTISLILVLINPFLLSTFLKNKNFKHFMFWIINCITLVMIGTNASTYSVFIINFVMIVIYLLSIFIKKKKGFNKILFLLLILALGFNALLINYSPAKKKSSSYDSYVNSIKNKKYKSKFDYNKFNELSNTPIDKIDKNELISFFDKNYKSTYISEKFIKTGYPYEYDPYFWLDLMKKLSEEKRTDNRTIQKAMLDRVLEIDNRVKFKILGIGYSRTSNLYNLEQDFVYQKYSLGYIGSFIFLSPYFVILLVASYYSLRRMFININIENYSLLLGIFLTLALSYYSGNSIDNLGITIVLGFVCGYILKNYKNA